MEKGSKTNPILWATFLDFAEANPIILTKKFDSINGRHKYDELWKEIATTLNSMGYLQKSLEKWQKAVADWKSKVKGKAADINKGLNKTGGGGPMPPLNDNEKRLMAIIGWSVSGTNIAELGFDSEANNISEDISVTISESNIGLCDYKISSPSPLHYPITSTCHMGIDTPTEPNQAVLQTPPKPLQERKVIFATRKRKTSTPQSRFKENVATRSMQQMHNETLDVLKQIEGHLGRMADIQEKICVILDKLVAKNAQE